MKNISVNLNNGLNVFYGDNAQGKTSFLESVYLCGTGRSHRANSEKALIMFNETESHIKAHVCDEYSNYKIDVHLKGNDKKGVAIDSVPLKKLGDLFGHLLVVVFSPEDLELIKGAPSIRRRFIDMELCQLSHIYYYNLQQYYKVLKQRNSLLKSIYKDPALISTLSVWDEQLACYGCEIIKSREGFIEHISGLAGKIYGEASHNNEALQINYKPSLSIKNYEDKLIKNRLRDIQLGSTGLGIHKDDIIFIVDGYDVRGYGSQGQQRTCALAVKLAEVELIKSLKKRSPVLLLDDVLSELDIGRQDYILRNIMPVQTIITTTGAYDIISRAGKKTFIFHVQNGNITFEGPSFMV
jgi:DNA replication and repair protein RecF